VLTMMVESADYFFFALGANDSATAFRSDIGHGALASPTQPILNFAIVHRPRLGPAGRGSAGLIPLELCRDMRARLPIESAYRSVA